MPITSEIEYTAGIEGTATSRLDEAVKCAKAGRRLDAAAAVQGAVACARPQVRHDHATVRQTGRDLRQAARYIFV